MQSSRDMLYGLVSRFCRDHGLDFRQASQLEDADVRGLDRASTPGDDLQCRVAS
jgi:hypothetical protein